jgi:hypothetical protein
MAYSLLPAKRRLSEASADSSSQSISGIMLLDTTSLLTVEGYNQKKDLDSQFSPWSSSHPTNLERNVALSRAQGEFPNGVELHSLWSEEIHRMHQSIPFPEQPSLSSIAVEHGFRDIAARGLFEEDYVAYENPILPDPRWDCQFESLQCTLVSPSAGVQGHETNYMQEVAAFPSQEQDFQRLPPPTYPNSIDDRISATLPVSYLPQISGTESSANPLGTEPQLREVITVHPNIEENSIVCFGMVSLVYPRSIISATLTLDNKSFQGLLENVRFLLKVVKNSSPLAFRRS